MVSYQEAKRRMKENTKEQVSPEAVEMFRKRAEQLLDRFAKYVDSCRANDTSREKRIKKVQVES